MRRPSVARRRRLAGATACKQVARTGAPAPPARHPSPSCPPATRPCGQAPGAARPSQGIATARAAAGEDEGRPRSLAAAAAVGDLLFDSARPPRDA
jgi:hypothetical protein